jgi:hypothetical protein
MTQIDMARMAAMMTFGEEYGCDPNLAGRAALALHPLDDQPVPSRAYEKAARKTARKYGLALRKSKGRPNDIEALSHQTLASYKSLALELGEAHYVHRYDKALGIESDN